ncbi:hypothetical protein F5884DRAFT_785173 [Xylogone sp. PMI_703]|nr:hypothetical protein F5884DRAFT_785173 [Xylogone sp. PMI_703]
MVRSVSRSRGCQRCASRKIKCDETAPHCLRCQRAKKPCPGVFKGLFMVHTVIKDPKPTPVSLATPSKNPIQLTDGSRLSHYQPSLCFMNQHYFLCHFISSFNESASKNIQHHSWMTYLFDYLSDSGTVTYAIRAAILAFYGTGNGDMDVIREADHWNLLALQAQRAVVARTLTPSKAISHIPTLDEICATLMLLYYELIRPSTIGSWLGHLRGLSQMVLLLGPYNCQSGVSLLFLRTVRQLMAYYSIWTEKPSFLATEEWTTIPFAQSGMTASDDLVNVLLSIPSLMELPKDKDASSKGTTPDSNKMENTLQLLSKTILESEQRQKQDADQEYESWSPTGGDFCTVIPRPAWQASRVLLAHVSSLQSTPSSEAFSEQEMIQYCSSILEFSVPICRTSINSINVGACIQLVFPLEVVVKYSPLDEQRNEARDLLDFLGWKKVNGCIRTV